MTHNLRKTIEDIWKEAYAEHGRRQDDAVRAAIEEEEAELIPHEDVVARLEATFGRPSPSMKRRT